MKQVLTFSTLLCCVFLLASPAGAQTFIRGDCNLDGDTDFYIGDMIAQVVFLFSGQGSPCADACDANDDGTVDVLDLVDTFNAATGRGSIPAPFPACGVDPTADSLGCNSSPCPNLPAPPAIDPDYQYQAVTTQGSLQEVVPVVVQYSAVPGAEFIQGFGFGLCHSSGLEVVGAVAPAAIENEGDAFLDLRIASNSVGFAALPDVFGLQVLAPGVLHDVLYMEYRILDAVDQDLTFCEEVAGFAYPIRVNLNGLGVIQPLALPATLQIAQFIRGDCNGDQGLDIADAIDLLAYLFTATASPGCLVACDANDDGQVDIADAIRVLDLRFLAGPPLPPPNVCDVDLEPEGLTCLAGPC